jgi:hypothetical protein
MANLSLVRSKRDLIVALIPQAADAVHPHGPRVVTNDYLNLLIADVTKEISAGLTDRPLQKRTLDLSKKMAAQASGSMVASWEPGDDLCPPWPIPWPLGRNDSQFHQLTKFIYWFDPDPVPWKSINAAEQIELAHTLTQLAGLTTSREFNTQLKALATDIAGAAAGRLADEFERCGTVPRKPIPRPRGGPAANRTLTMATSRRRATTLKPV